MAWLRPTVDHLKLVLSQDEIDKLSECSNELSSRIQDQLDAVADQFRSAFASKGYNVDVRPHYVDEGYLIPMLNYSRYQIWTTFPMTESYSLSEPREKLYSQAVDLLKDPYLGTSKPDYSDDPELSGDPALNIDDDSAVTMPWMKFPAQPFDTGFWQPYAYEIEKLTK